MASPPSRCASHHVLSLPRERQRRRSHVITAAGASSQITPLAEADFSEKSALLPLSYPSSTSIDLPPVYPILRYLRPLACPLPWPLSAVLPSCSPAFAAYPNVCPLPRGARTRTWIILAAPGTRLQVGPRAILCRVCSTC